MTRSWLWNGATFLADATVPLTDRGFRYGMSLFESILVRDGMPVFLREHLEKLRAACGERAFAAALPQLARIARLLEGCETGLARIYVTAGDGAVTSPVEHPRVFVTHEGRELPPSRVYHRGYDLRLAEDPHSPAFGGLKTGNYWANIAAFQAGVAQQKNETLLFDTAGELISACMANAFLVRDGVVVTPGLAVGARAGVVRDWVLQQRPVAEMKLSRDDVATADEVFLTSSWIGIMPVASVNRRALPSTTYASSLRREYSACLPGGNRI
jgi:branched-subunit amino acid aminotransferase/4-amino-4-deoxychorismate lyase